MKIFGIDSGFANVGLAVVEIDASSARDHSLVAFEHFGTKKVDAKQKILATEDNTRRAGEIAAWLRPRFREHRPFAVALESMSWPRNASVAAKMGIGFGVVITLCEAYGVRLIQSSPQNTKKGVGCAPSASKKVVQDAIAQFYPEVLTFRSSLLKGVWEHPHDALAVAHTAINGDTIQIVLSSMRSR